MGTGYSCRGTVWPENPSDDFSRQSLVLGVGPRDRYVTVLHDQLCPASSYLSRNSGADPRRLRRSEGLWAGAQ